MRILKTYEDAYRVGMECLLQKTAAKKPRITQGLSKLPQQVHGPWMMNEQALVHTLRYIFEKLHHSCYMLCVTQGIPELLKLESTTTAPTFKPLLIQKLSKTLKAPRRRELAKTLKSKQWRVMQCVVKPYKKQSTASVEFEAFMDNIPFRLPDGVFILNLTDAVILRKDGTEPWQMVTGNKPLGEYAFDTFLPILNGSGQEGYWDIPMPNYDDVRLMLGFDKLKGTPELNWDAKMPRAVFRGGPTGCGITPETNQRIKLATMVSDELDVGLVKTKSDSIKFDAKYGLGQIQVPVKAVGFLDLIADQSRYKYIIHVDGNVAAFRLLKSMLTGSLIVRVKSPYTLWVDHVLKEGVHYVSVKEDLSDLQEVIDWCKEHDDKARKMAEAGLAFAQKALTRDYITGSFAKLLWAVSS
jgi:hypothetical protein